MAVIDNSTQRKFTTTLKSGIVNEIVFPDTKPNHVHVNNYGSAKLYFAMSNIPSSTSYDMVIYPYKADIYGQDTSVDRIRIYVDSTEDCRVEITSYYAPFDPVILNKPNEVAITQIEGTVSSTIDGFNAPLPSGTNNIGAVSVSNIPHVIVDTMPSISLSDVTIDASGLTDLTLAAGTNVIGKVKIENENSYYFYSGTASVEPMTVTSLNIHHVCFIANEGDYDMKISFGTEEYIVLKAGEILNDLPLKASSYTVSTYSSTESVPFRILAV